MAQVVQVPVFTFIMSQTGVGQTKIICPMLGTEHDTAKRKRKRSKPGNVTENMMRNADMACK